MNPSDRDTKKASTKKRIKWYTQQFMVECLKETNLKDWLQQDSGHEYFGYRKCCQITLIRAIKSILLWHKDSDIHKSSVAKLYSIARFMTYQCAKSVSFYWSTWGLPKNLTGSPERNCETSGLVWLPYMGGYFCTFMCNNDCSQISEVLQLAHRPRSTRAVYSLT